MKFDKKLVKCAPSDVYSKISELEAEWIIGLLRRFKVDPVMIERANSDENYGKNEWRRFLFEKYGIRIEKDLVSQKVVIRRLNFKTYEDIVLGQWTNPEIVRVESNDGRFCEIHLKYWQIV